MLAEGFHPVPSGMLATVVTHLEMAAPPAVHAPRWPDGLACTRWSQPDPERYRQLFRAVGADWLWCSRLRLADAELAAILHDPGVELWVLSRDGADLGLCELDLRAAPQRGELAYFGLAPPLLGQGLGARLMAHALQRAFAAPLACLTVHTCTLDHPGALAFYRRSGFQAVRQEVEILRDPRCDGTLPASAAPHVPLAVAAGAMDLQPPRV